MALVPIKIVKVFAFERYPEIPKITHGEIGGYLLIKDLEI
jgi:hypothetical protein